MKNQAVAVGKDDLVKAKEMNKLGTSLQQSWRIALMYGLHPIWGKYYHAMELIDPTAPAYIPDGTWERVEDICNRYNLS